ncbi:hypothetical protein E8E14_011041 [Neopestalotiopsis sp. 37M]|nr:hypothetical protein E8E14_011041 [Neopestalotiopsis sp. 37M]
MTVNNETRSRFVIRPLDVSHIEWVSAIFAHSHLFHNKAWRDWLPERNLTALAYEVLGTSEYLMRHQLESGYSLGMFDKEYQFKNPDSAPTGGKLWWDDENANADGQLLLEQMDFPLVSIALAYDSINPLDPAGMAPLIASLPPTKDIFGILAALDPRDPATWCATAPGQVLFRNATNTRADYEGHGLMARMARHMMFRSAEQGFRAIQIECMNNPVTHVWSHPPPPFKGEIISEFQTKTYQEKDENGKMVAKLGSADQRMTKCYVTLR